MEGGAPDGAAREVDELDEVGRLDEAPGVDGVMGLLSEVDLRLLELLDDPDALPFVVGAAAPAEAHPLSLRFVLWRDSELALRSALAF